MGPDVGGHCLSVILAAPETDIRVDVFFGGLHGDSSPFISSFMDAGIYFLFHGAQETSE